MIHHIGRINQENQQTNSQKQLQKTYDKGRQAHTNFRNPSGYKVHSLSNGNTVYVYAEIKLGNGAL